jgi:transcriptional regulator with XRE-family HTH domain
MHCGYGYERDKLRALLREARGKRRQTEIAAAAKVSIGLYKRLESGRLQTSRLPTLMRIADALGLSAEDRAKLIALGRPDLARMIEPESAAAHALLASLRRLAIRLGRVRGRNAALRTAVELLHASLAPDGMSFVFETQGPDRMRTGFSVGADLWGRAFPQGSGVTMKFGPKAVRRTGSGIQTLCVGIREPEDVIVVLGFASTSDCELDPKHAEFLETIAAVLEIRLSDHAVTSRW